MKTFYYLLFLNGQKYKIYSTKYVTLSDILNHLTYSNQLIILEYNQYISPKVLYKTFLKSKDYLEIITIVGGG